MDEKVKETLEKQLQLLSKRSQCTLDGYELARITHAMVEIADRLPSRFVPECGDGICTP